MAPRRTSKLAPTTSFNSCVSTSLGGGEATVPIPSLHPNCPTSPPPSPPFRRRPERSPSTAGAGPSLASHRAPNWICASVPRPTTVEANLGNSRDCPLHADREWVVFGSREGSQLTTNLIASGMPREEAIEHVFDRLSGRYRRKSLSQFWDRAAPEYLVWRGF